MSDLANLDLNRIGVDADSLLGRAVALGREFDKLPPGAEAGLAAYLRLQGTLFARRYRSGVAVGRDGLERGVRRAFISIELALEEETGGDLNAAVEVLGRGTYDAWRKKGWETAHFRLEEMREQAIAWLEAPEAALLKDDRAAVEVWSRIQPESWQGTDYSEADAGIRVEVDPSLDYRRCQAAVFRLRFVRALPAPALQELVEQHTKGMAWGGLLRQAAASAVLGLESLLLAGAEPVAAAHAFREGAARRRVEKLVLDLVDRLEGGAEARAGVLEVLRQEMEVLATAAAADLDALLVARRTSAT